MELTESLKSLLKETAQTLKGYERRRFMAKTVEQLGVGGQRKAERELGWNRHVIRKGQREVNSGLIERVWGVDDHGAVFSLQVPNLSFHLNFKSSFGFAALWQLCPPSLKPLSQRINRHYNAKKLSLPPPPNHP